MPVMVSNWQVVTLIAMTFTVTMIITPYIIDRMRRAGILGVDVNKRHKPRVPEMCGVAGIISFAICGGVMAVVTRIVGNGSESDAIMAALCAMALAGMVGIIDDLYGMRRWKKAIYVCIAGMPLAILGLGEPVIELPGYTIDFSMMPWVFWLILVPIGVTGVANAINMSAGYNGLETGEMAIISLFLLAISFIRDPSNPAILIFAMILGSSIGMYFYNRYPARMFVGDVGTLGMGAGIAAGVIIGGLEFYGVICIIPAFYELAATLYARSKGVERRDSVMKPIILKNGKIVPRKGTGWYTLFFRILSVRPMRERQLVACILGLYAIAGSCALGVSIFFPG